VSSISAAGRRKSGSARIGGRLGLPAQNGPGAEDVIDAEFEVKK
jgi:hypothetical protein